MTAFLPVRHSPAATLRSAVAAAVFGGSGAFAALIAYEDFEGYAAGSNLDGASLGATWAGDWTTFGGHTTVQTTTLVDPTGNVSAGLQAARLQPTANLADVPDFMVRPFASTSDTVYLGFLIRNGGGIDNADFLNFQVSDGATGNTTSALGVGIRNNPGNPFFARVGDSGSGSSTTNSSTNATVDTTFLLVAKFSKDGGSSTYNRTDLFINPLDANEPVTADATASSGVTGLSSLSLFSVRNFQPEAGDTVFIDELRIGTSFADVVPEPSHAVLLLLGGGALLLRRRR
jgi:hypothetical protein